MAHVFNCYCNYGLYIYTCSKRSGKCIKPSVLARTSQVGYYPLGKCDAFYTAYTTLSSVLNRKTINSEENCVVMNKLVKEMKALNPRFESADVRGMTKCL